MKGRRVSKFLLCAGIVGLWVLIIGIAPAGAQTSLPSAPAVERSAETAAGATARWDLAIAIAVSISMPCLGAGYAVGKVGAAALGAASEKPELLTRSLIFVALAEGIAIYGLLIAILLWIKF